MSQLSTSARQLRLVGALLAAVVAILGAAYYWFLSGDYGVLARGVRPEQAAAIVDQLKKDEVSYELRDGGATILVPSSKLDSSRLEVATSDLPVKGTVGFELFNQSDMGLTDFAQKVNYQRALQGEIARTIMGMDGIAYARVHLALPERTLFRTNASEPRAAVTLTPQPGVSIDSGRIAGIQRLVAAAVPDLAIDQVAILDARGELLTPEFSDVPAAASSGSALEANYSERVATAIAGAAPRAHVQVKVTVVPLSVAAAGGNAATRRHSIRVVLFERSPLSPTEEQAVRRAVTSELLLSAEGGDQLLFSPAPEVAAGEQAAVIALPPAAAAPDEAGLMEQIDRAWAIVLGLLAAVVVGGFAVIVTRTRRQRRTQLVVRIREQLALADGALSAP